MSDKRETEYRVEGRVIFLEELDINATSELQAKTKWYDHVEGKYDDYDDTEIDDVESLFEGKQFIVTYQTIEAHTVHVEAEDLEHAKQLVDESAGFELTEHGNNLVIKRRLEGDEV